MQNTLAYAQAQDAADGLAHFREKFLIPKHNGKDLIYFCGNSLGLQPKNTRIKIEKHLLDWENMAIEGYFEGDEPWMYAHKAVRPILADWMGASEIEVCPMANLTVNLQLMLASFYIPNGTRTKIVMEAGAFPSDQYAVETHLKLRGQNPETDILEISPREGEYTLRTEDILEVLEQNKNEIALLMLGGINYYTGQLFDIKTITAKGKSIGAMVGWDLAHVAGNVPLELHAWEVDFAAWCSYKYWCSGPGGMSGIFVNEKYANDNTLNRLAGWWGYDEATRFKMTKGFVPQPGAEGWGLSCNNMLALTSHQAALEIYAEAGKDKLRKKAIALTAFAEFIISEINDKIGDSYFKIITPTNPEERGSQLSIIVKQDGKKVFDALTANGVIGDWREPNVIRIAPKPMYNTFEEVYKFGVVLSSMI